jgi:hypothetical protein
VQKPADPARPASEKKAFGGWFQEPYCLTPYNFGSSLLRDRSLYAKWLPILTVEFSTIVDNKAAAQNVPSAQSVVQGYMAHTPATVPTFTGTTFKGWYRYSEAVKEILQGQTAEPFDFVNTPITESIMLYALWNGPNTYNFQIDLNGGTLLENKYEIIIGAEDINKDGVGRTTYEYGRLIELGGTWADPAGGYYKNIPHGTTKYFPKDNTQIIREGYKLLGWYEVQSAENSDAANVNHFYQLAATRDTVIRADWKKMPDYTVKFYITDWAADNGPLGSVTVPYNDFIPHFWHKDLQVMWSNNLNGKKGYFLYWGVKGAARYRWQFYTWRLNEALDPTGYLYEHPLKLAGWYDADIDDSWYTYFTGYFDADGSWHAVRY